MPIRLKNHFTGFNLKHGGSTCFTHIHESLSISEFQSLFQTCVCFLIRIPKKLFFASDLILLRDGILVEEPRGGGGGYHPSLCSSVSAMATFHAIASLGISSFYQNIKTANIHPSLEPLSSCLDCWLSWMCEGKSQTHDQVFPFTIPPSKQPYTKLLSFFFFPPFVLISPFQFVVHISKKNIHLTYPSPFSFLIQVFIKNRNTCLVQLPWVVHLHRLFLLQLLLQRRRRRRLHPIQSAPSVHHLSFLVLSVIPPPLPPLMQNHHHHHQQQKPQRPSHHQLQQQQLVLLQHLKYLIPHFQVELVLVMVAAMGREVPVLALVVQHSTTH